jgi:Holliday junction resolvase RusA-like endonuclease
VSRQFANHGYVLTVSACHSAGFGRPISWSSRLTLHFICDGSSDKERAGEKGLDGEESGGSKASAGKKAGDVKKGGGTEAKKRAAPKNKKDLPPAEIAKSPAPEFFLNERASFVITVRPLSKHRPRFSGAGMGRGRVFSPSAREANKLRQKLHHHLSQNRLLDGQATLFKKEAKLAFQADFMLHTRRGRRPDIDNLLKFILDALNQCVWYDDGQVREVLMRMRTAASPEDERTVVIVTESSLLLLSIECAPFVESTSLFCTGRSVQRRTRRVAR